MKNTAVKSNPEIINVIDEFDYSTQQESYNKEFVKWRKNKENPYAYNFELNTKESVFIDGQGFVSESAEKSESETSGKILYLIGIAMLVATAVENVLDKLIVQLLDIIGFDIHVTFFNSAVYGGKTEVVTVLILNTLLKLLLPMLVIHAGMKMPRKLSRPMSLNEPGELIATIAAAMIVCVVTGLPAVFIDETKEIYTFFRAYNADMSVWGQNEFLIYTFFDVIVVSVLFELLFRGEMFQALRQFGDGYAIIITSLISGILTQDYKAIVATALISAVSSIGMLRSGTIFTAIAARITYKLYIMALNLLEMSSSENMFLNRNFFMLCVFLGGLVIFTIVFLNRKRRERRIFAEYHSYLTLKKRIAIPLKTLPLTAAMAICIVAAIMNMAL